MKKYISMLFVALVAMNLVSCDVYTDEEAAGTAVEKMAGTWTVTFEQSVDEYYYLFEGGVNPNLSTKTADELDKMEWEDIRGKGKVTMMTFNTAANSATEMWFYDNNFWDAKVKVDVDYIARTFSCKDKEAYEYEDCKVNIIGGKVLEGAATTPRGYPADSIIAYVCYSDDNYGFTYTKMSGYRYTGFSEDK